MDPDRAVQRDGDPHHPAIRRLHAAGLLAVRRTQEGCGVRAAGLTFHRSGSADSGMPPALALIGGCIRRAAKRIGNSWVGLKRRTLDVPLPVSSVTALRYGSEGMAQ